MLRFKQVNFLNIVKNYTIKEYEVLSQNYAIINPFIAYIEQVALLIMYVLKYYQAPAIVLYQQGYLVFLFFYHNILAYG
jgi:hypothetical protein